MKGDEFRLSACGEFLNPALEEKYQQLNWPRVSRQLRWVTMIEAVAYTSALVLNYIAFGTDSAFWVMATVRMIEAAILIAACIACYAARYNFRARALIFASQIFITFSEVIEYYLYLEQQGSFQDIGTPFILVAGFLKNWQARGVERNWYFRALTLP
ncbi:MAG: hypothetical protein HN816_13820 [Gammaproteobacteria bacterium]|nr:hypothetical protein [Gammaproteobacteria bacterium]